MKKKKDTREAQKAKDWRILNKEWLSTTQYDSYSVSIERELSKSCSDWTFKSDKEYVKVLEHVSQDLGAQYLIEIKNRYGPLYEKNKKLLIELCQKNDLYGKTIKSQFDEFTTCSPTNLRYIFQSFLILDDIKKSESRDIIEIGGGYGGLCFFMFNLAKLFDITIRSYAIFDLLPASLLQEKYLKSLNIKNTAFFQLEDFSNLRVGSFLISNYAFSEIEKDLQHKYTQKIINPYTSYGFLAWNRGPDLGSVYGFVNDSIIEEEKAYPKGRSTYVRFRPE